VSKILSATIFAAGAFGFTLAAPAAQIGANFAGASFEDVITLPPDTMGAVGPDHFVQFINGGFIPFNKDGSLTGAEVDDETFWANAGFDPGSGNLSDPRILYDPGSTRWFAIQVTTENTDNRVMLARSDTSDPTGTWKEVNFIGNSGGTARFADFPTLGVDANGVYIAANMFDSVAGNNFKSASIFSIPKADLVQANPSLSGMKRFEGLSASVSTTDVQTLQPVVNFSANPAHASVLLVGPPTAPNNYATLSKLTLTATSGTNPTLSGPTSIAVTAFNDPSLARQPDGTQTIASNDARFSSYVSQVGDTIWAVHNVNVNGHPALRWYKIDDTTNIILQSGTVSDPAGHFDYFFPSITANANGDVVIAFNRSGDSTTGDEGRISAYALIGTTSGVTTAFNELLLLKQGEVSDYHLEQDLADNGFVVGFDGTERWGDYSTITVDPSNPNGFWTVQEIPIPGGEIAGLVGANTEWSTQITEILVPEPASVSVLLICGALATRRCRRT
jgi:hypothetical protein